MKLPRAFSYVIIILVAFVNFAPAMWTVLTSLKTELDAIAIPPKLLFQPTLSAYVDLLLGNAFGVEFGRFTLNSAKAAGITTAITVSVSLSAAYSLARMRFRGRNAAGLLILATRMLPPIATILPLYLFVNMLGLLDTIMSLVLAYTAIGIPLAVWLLRGYILDVPMEVEESALIDGCNRLQTIVRIVIPLILPGLLTVAFLTFLLAWNDFEIMSVLAFERAKTLPVAVTFFITQQGIIWPSMTAVATVMLIPPIMFVLLAQKYFVTGLGSGAIR
jgi:multiple sugar transport system permease protein